MMGYIFNICNAGTGVCHWLPCKKINNYITIRANVSSSMHKFVVHSLMSWN